VEQGCCIELFLMPNQYCDVASLASLTHRSAGRIHKYDFFSADTHGARLCDDLRYSVANATAFDAVMKVRTSTGIKAVDYLGCFNTYGSDIEFAGLHRDAALSVEIKHEDKLNENSKVLKDGQKTIEQIF